MRRIVRLMRGWLDTPTKRRTAIASCLILIGFALTVWLGVWAAQQDAPSGSQSAVLVLLAGIFQVGGAGALHRIGKADPTLARTAVRHLLHLSDRANTAKRIAETAVESDDAESKIRAVGDLSVHLSWLEEGLIESVEQWNEFHADAIKSLMKEDKP